MYQFTPKKTFFSKEFQSEYVQGMNYTVRDGEQHEKLHTLVQEKWISEGLVQIGIVENKES